MIAALLIGFGMSFAGSIPIAGPIAVTIVSLALDHRTKSAMFVAVGAAFAEAIWAFLAFWGFSTVLAHFPFVLPAARLVGCALLVGLGVYLAVRKSKTQKHRDEKKQKPGPHNVLVGFTLTVVNPTLLVTWTAAVSAAHASGLLRVHPHDAWFFALGVAGGVVAWFGLMLAGLRKLRSRITPRMTNAIVHGMGIAVAVLGVALFVRTIVHWPS